MKMLKNNFKYRQEGYVSKDEAHINIALADENGNVVAKTIGTAIYQKKKGKEYFRINTAKLGSELQDMFWFTSACTIFNENKEKNDKIKFDNSKFKEMISIESIANKNAENSGIVIKPYKRVDENFTYLTNNKNNDEIEQINTDIKSFLRMLKSIMQLNIFRLHTNEEENSAINNKIVNAGQWKSASEFNGFETSLENCIYYLASDPDDEKPSFLYIGETMNSGIRLQKKIKDGKAYIGHKEREDDYSKYKFTRYRIDQISSIDALHNAQDTIIGAFEMADSTVFKNGFTITNKAFNKAYSKAKKNKK